MNGKWKRLTKIERPKSFTEESFDDVHQASLDIRRDERGVRAGLITALGIGHLGADIARGIISLGRHGHEQVGPQPLRGELVLDEQLAQQVQHSRLAQAQA
jgi:hypothetical protein